jgi:hypothetical protein
VTDSPLSPALANALAYSKRGWHVFPCRPGGKVPLTPHGFKDATRDAARLVDWWRRWPDANVAIATGAVSNLIVLDIDPRHGGDDTLAELEHKHGVLPATPSVKTPGGGAHYYFRHPGGHVPSGPVAEGVDLKADGGYVLAPPSRVRDRRYEFDVRPR